MGVPRLTPHVLIVEHYNQCNLRCRFCARTYTPEPERKMDVELFRAIVDDVATWVKRIRVDLTPIGEPFMNDLLFEYVKLASERIPKPYILVFSNGVLLARRPELMVEFFECGGHQLVIDIYVPELLPIVLDRVEGIRKRLESLGVEVYQYRDDVGCIDEEGKVHRIHLYWHKGSKRYLIVNHACSVETQGRGRVRRFHNMGGHLPPGIPGIDYHVDVHRHCMRPHRELVVDYHGCVRLCCQCIWNDIVAGKFPDDGSLADIWNNELMWVYRWFLRHAKAKRVLPPCSRCSYHGSFRPVEKVPKPDFIDVTDLAAVLRFIEDWQSRYVQYKHPYCTGRRPTTPTILDFV